MTKATPWYPSADGLLAPYWRTSGDTIHTSHLSRVLKNAESDLFENLRIPLNPMQKTQILEEAKRRLDEHLGPNNPGDFNKIEEAWRMVVTDFHQNQYWGLNRASPEA